MTAEEIRRALARGELVPDDTFDRLYPDEIRYISEIHFTPLAVARRFIELVRPSAQTRVLDVGSGVGKFCVAAALLGPGRYAGVERSEHRHGLAVQTAASLGVSERVELILGNAFEVNWSAFDVLYFYNPFQYLVLQRPTTPEAKHAPEIWDRNQRTARHKLRALPVGARVVTYHGLGEELPSSFDQLHGERIDDGDFEIWIQRLPRD